MASLNIQSPSPGFSNITVATSNALHDVTTSEKSHFLRLMSLIVDEGRERIKEYVLAQIPPSSSLENALKRRAACFKKLKTSKKITEEKYDILYPPSGMVQQDEVDFGLWYTLARNLHKNNFKWGHYEHNPPSPHETDPPHDVVRIRNARNNLAHSNTASLSSRDFRRMWDDISAAILRLNPTQETRDKIENYLDCDLDQITTQKMYLAMKEEALQETEAQYKREVARKRCTVIGFLITIVVVVLAMGGVAYFLFRYGRTWESCTHNLKFISISDGVIGYMSREGWGALPRKSGRGPFPHPAHPRNMSIIATSEVIGQCATTNDCCAVMKNVQKYDMQSGFADICYSFLIGNDGVIYEGRGFKEVPATARGWNIHSISIAFIGNYEHTLPSDDALTAAKVFLQYSANLGVVNRNFTIYGLCQVRPYPDEPGSALYTEIQKWSASDPDFTWSWRPRTGWCRNASVTLDVVL